MLPIILITVAMGLSVYFIGLLDYRWSFLKLLIMSSAGMIIYLILAFLFKTKASNEVMTLIKNKIYNEKD
jgi:hypothetical protein